LRKNGTTFPEFSEFYPDIGDPISGQVTKSSLPNLTGQKDKGGKNMETEQSRTLVSDLLAAQFSGDQQSARALIDPDAEFVIPVSVNLHPPKGPAGILDFQMEQALKFFDMATARIDTLKIVADGDTVVVRSHVEVKAMNGRDYVNEVVHIYTCKNGKVVRLEEHMDSLLFKEIVLDS